MASTREPRQIAKRAFILGAISFRSALEVTDHLRVLEISRRLLPWLEEMGCDDELDPIERELLATPVGHLSDSQRIDANWAGEAAAFFCWTLNLSEPLELAHCADPSALPGVLCILKPEAAKILRSASLRDRAEIEDTCRQFALIRSMLQESRLEPPAREVMRRANVQRMNDVGPAISDEAATRASETVSHMTAQARSEAAGLYFVRNHAALWFLSDRSSYFG